MVRLLTIVIVLMIQNAFTQNTQVELKAQQEIDFKNVEGIWENDGYGRILQIVEQEITIYDICKINCNNSMVMSYEMASKSFLINRTSDSTLIAQDGLNNYYFKKIDKLPELCSDKSRKDEALYNFEVLWQTFNEHYVYFEERNIDWNALKIKYQNQITKTIKSFDFFLLMEEMLDEINDGHVNLYAPNDLRKKYKKHQKQQRKIRVIELRKKLGKNIKIDPIVTEEVALKTIKKYVKDVKIYNLGVLNYGLISKDIALVQVNGMDDFANYKIPEGYSVAKSEKLYEEQSSKSKNYKNDNIDGAGYILDKIISEISETKVCIIDIRFNGGGEDTIGLEILKRFAKNDTLVFSKKAKNKSGFTKKQYAYLKPSKNTYKGKIYLLTSHYTASAAETFTMATMITNPKMVRIGSNTHGVFSDMLNKKLPNGWEYSLSNEIYENFNGISYEVIGISPHYNIEYPKKGYWFFRKFKYDNTNKDLAIEKVLELEKINP